MTSYTNIKKRFYPKFIIVLSLFLIFTFKIHAQIKPENVMGINCLSSYQNTYLKLKDSKVFIYARERDTDKDKCSWSYDYPSIEEATKSALQECDGKLNAKCQVVDKNGEFIAKKLQFSYLEPLDNSSLVKKDRNKIMNTAKLLVKGNCYPFFDQYLSAQGHKAFAYAIDQKGNYACGYSYKNQTKKISKKRAMISCKDNLNQRGKKKPKSECKVYAESNKLVLTNQDYGLEENYLVKQDLSNALHKGNVKKVKEYLSQGLDINTEAKDGMTPLFLAASKGEEAWFYELLSKGANINHKMKDGSNLLIAAVFGESPDIVRYLLAKNFDINSKSRGGNRPIHIAFKRLNTYLIKLLVRAGADLTLKNDKGISGNEKLLNAKIDVDKIKQIKPNESNDGFYPLFDAVKYGDLYMIKYLKEKGADINKIERYGMSPYSMAKNKPTIELLHKLGADINHQDDEGETALMYVSDDLTKVNILLELGADKSLKDKKGETAYSKIKDRKTVDNETKRLLKN